MDIGSLTGQVAIQDQVSGKLVEISNSVKTFAQEVEGGFGAAAIAVGVLTAAIVGMTISIVELGKKGSDVNDVTATLEHFAGSATEATKVLEAMRAGVKGTVDDFELAKTASRLLSANVKLSAEDFQQLTNAAFVLQNRGLGSTKEMMDLVADSMVTGRTRALAMKLGVVEVKDATADFAKSLGVEASQLNEAGVAEARRSAIMKMLTQANKDAGEQQRDFGEQFEFAEAKLANWVDELAGFVASSPNVNNAVQAIGTALSEAFGNDADTMMATIVSWINSFADAVTKYGPIVVQTFADILHGIRDVFNFIAEHKEEIKTAAEVVGVYAAAWAVLTIGGSLVTGVVQGLTAIRTAMLLASGAGAVGAGGAAAASSFWPVAVFTLLSVAVIQAGKDIRGLIKDIQDGKPAFDILKDGIKSYYQSKGMVFDKPTLPSTTFAGPQGLPNVGPSDNLNGAGAAKPARNFLKEGESEKVTTATNASIQATEKLWDEYFSLVDARNVKTVESQLREVDRWYQGARTALDKGKKDNLDYYNQLAALDSVAAERRRAASNEGMNEAAERAVTQLGLAIREHTLPNMVSLNDNLNKMFGLGTLASHSLQGVSNMTTLVGDSASKVDKIILDGINERIRANRALSADQQRQVEQLHQLGYTADQIAQIMGISIKQVTKLTYDWRDSLSTVASAMAQLGQITGGIMGSIAGQIANIIGSLDLAVKSMKEFQKAREAGDKIGMATSMLGGVTAVAQATGSGSTASRVIGGAAAGAQVGAATGIPFGGLIGGAIGGVVGLVRGIGGPSEEELDAREKQNQLTQQYTSLASEAQKATIANLVASKAWSEQSATLRIVGGDAMERIGASAAQTETIVKGLLDTHHPEKFAAAMKQVNDALLLASKIDIGVNNITTEAAKLHNVLPAALKASVTEMLKLKGLTEEQKSALKALVDGSKVDYEGLTNEAAKYGITLQQLGPKFQQADITKKATDIYNLFTQLQDAGADYGGTLAGFAPHIADLVEEAKKAGGTLPKEFEPWIQQLIAGGGLVDSAGEKITDLTGITFAGSPLESGMDKLTKSIDALVEVLGGVPKQLDAINKTPVQDKHMTIFTRFQTQNEPPQAPATGAAAASANPPTEGSGEPGNAYAATGGTIYAGGGTVVPFKPKQVFVPKETDVQPAMLTPGETVRTIAQEQTVQNQLAATQGGFMPVSVQIDRREIARAVVPVIPAELRRRGAAA